MTSHTGTDLGGEKGMSLSMFVLKWRGVIGVVTVAFALYALWQAIAIADAGVIHQIPQLEGDGGGALLFAVVLAVAGMIAMWSPIVAVWLYFLAMLIGTIVALLYQDLMLWFWVAGTLALCVASLTSIRRARHRPRAGAA